MRRQQQPYIVTVRCWRHLESNAIAVALLLLLLPPLPMPLPSTVSSVWLKRNPRPRGVYKPQSNGCDSVATTAEPSNASQSSMGTGSSSGRSLSHMHCTHALPQSCLGICAYSAPQCHTLHHQGSGRKHSLPFNTVNAQNHAGTLQTGGSAAESCPFRFSTLSTMP
jgi:hypothetical protein